MSRSSTESLPEMRRGRSFSRDSTSFVFCLKCVSMALKSGDSKSLNFSTNGSGGVKIVILLNVPLVNSAKVAPPASNSKCGLLS